MKIKMSTIRELVRKQLREDHGMDHAGRDFDHAPGFSSDADMARTQLKNIAARASSLHDTLQDEDDLPSWVLSKMGAVDAYMTSLSDYLHGEMDRVQDDPSYTSEYHSEPQTHGSMQGMQQDMQDMQDADGMEDMYDAKDMEDMEDTEDVDMDAFGDDAADTYGEYGQEGDPDDEDEDDDDDDDDEDSPDAFQGGVVNLPENKMRTVKLTESQLREVIKRLVNEQFDNPYSNPFASKGNVDPYDFADAV